VRVKGSLYIHGNQQTFKATVNFNGGTLEWARPYSSWEDCPYGNDNTATKNYVSYNVLAGGMNVTNDVEMWFYPKIKSGVASGETDGGLTKWGSKTFALMTAGNTFNGPLTVMQGIVSLGTANPLPSTTTVRVNDGAAFNMNTRSQTLARMEGGGRFSNVVSSGTKLLTVTSAIAPGMGADSPGTLTVAGGEINIADNTALEIDVLSDGSADCLSYPGNLDLASMRLVINDGSKLDKNHTYTIVQLGEGALLHGAFASVTGLPDTWRVKYDTANRTVQLRYISPFRFLVR